MYEREENTEKKEKNVRLTKDLSSETEKMLLRIYKDSKSPQVRRRAHCILLRFRGFGTEKLMIIFGVSRRTLQYWYKKWEEEKLVGLYDQTGRGRKTKLKEEQREQVREWVKQEPKNLKRVIEKIQKEWGVDVSKDTVKRILKKFEMRWKRMKRGVNGEPLSWEYEIKVEKILELKEQEKEGEIDLRYLDEAGICLSPYVPYGWQEKGETITIKSRSSSNNRLNILGLMNRKNELEYQLHTQKVTSELIVSFLDQFSQKITQRTVVIMDQAPIHTSEAMMKKREEWKARNLELFWLPAYSPKLNLIEILWKFLKYEWIEVEAYQDWKSLVKYVKTVLDNLGAKCAINFA